MRQEIVSYQKTHKYKVVHYPFEIVSERQLDVFKLKTKILSHHCNLNELELDRSRKTCFVFGVISSTFIRHVTLLFTFVTNFVPGLHKCFSENKKVCLVCAETQHDQVSISTVNTMTDVWIVGLLSSLRANEVQNFVFTFPRHKCI